MRAASNPWQPSLMQQTEIHLEGSRWILKADSVDTAVITLFGDSLRVTGRRPVYGGDINQSYRLSFSDGSTLFMKCNSVRNLLFFTAEAQGVSFLLMEYLESASKGNHYWEVFGRELAAYVGHFEAELIALIDDRQTLHLIHDLIHGFL